MPVLESLLHTGKHTYTSNNAFGRLLCTVPDSALKSITAGVFWGEGGALS